MTAATPTVKTAPKIQISASIRRVVLIGFMGAGKSTVGRLLADSLQWNFLDLDAHLEARANSTIPELFALGEPHFRRVESSALANALARQTTVLALGGGAPEQLTNRLLIEQTPGTFVIHLDAPFPTLFDRCMLQSFSSPQHIRPVLASPAEAEARLRARQPFYQRLAHLALSTVDLTPSAISASILDHLATLKK